MRVDVGEPGLNVGDVMGIMCGVGARDEFGALEVGRQHEINQRRRAAGRLLLDASEPDARGQRNRPAFRRDLAADQPEQRRLAGAVAADEARARAAGHENAGMVEEQPVAEPIDEIVDREHRRDALRPRPRGRKPEMRAAIWRRPPALSGRPRLYTRRRAAMQRQRTRAHRLEA